MRSRKSFADTGVYFEADVQDSALPLAASLAPLFVAVPGIGAAISAFVDLFSAPAAA
jgi:hypothetical protein